MIFKERKSKWWVLWTWWFPGANMRTCAILFAGTLYIPEGAGEVLPDTRVHEIMHLKTMGTGFWPSVLWQLKYRLSRSFRLHEEAVAFQAQYYYGKQIMPSYEAKMRYMQELAEGLAGPTYGLNISVKEAKELIMFYQFPAEVTHRK